MGIEPQFVLMGDGGDGCTTVNILMPRSCSLKNGKDSKFYVQYIYI